MKELRDAHICGHHEADNFSMNLIKILFANKQTIRISRDHLPGLRPPKAAPFRPTLATEEPPSFTKRIDEAHKRFKASDAGKKNYKKDKGGFDF